MAKKERHKITVAACMILRKDDTILLLKRKNTGYCDGDYGLPSGHVEPNEHVLNTMLRETKEEVGIVLTKSQATFLAVQHWVETDPPYMYFYYESSDWQGTVTNLEPNKCDKLLWAPVDNLPVNIVPHLRLALDQGLLTIKRPAVL